MNRVITLNNGKTLPSIGLGSYDSAHLVKSALQLGYRQLDCAYLYKNQTDIGIVIENAMREGAVKRDELFVTSKLPMNGMRKEKVEYFLRKSLQQLRLEYVDLYLIHAPFAVKYIDDNEFYPVDSSTGSLLEDDVDFCETWKQMEQMFTNGLVKSIGLSNFNTNQIERILQRATIKPSVLQVELHAYLQQTDLVQYCKHRGIVVQAFASLGSPLTAKQRGNAVVLEDEILKRIAVKHNKTTAQIMLRWLTQNGIAAVPRANDECQLKENIEIFDFTLTAEEDSLIRNMDKGERLYWFQHTKGVKEHREYPF